MLRDLPPITDPRVIVSNQTNDDAGVIILTDDIALVQTVDFFTPVVDDPYWYGAIAAANALSDVYAMGGTPYSALAIAAFPDDLPHETIAAILRGGIDKAKEAGIDILGGHTVRDAEPKYGLAVTGIVHPDKVLRNSSARAGDVLFLTKPLGSGILTTARRNDAITAVELEPAIAIMATLNRAAALAFDGLEIHAATDITGFGMLGHLAEMTLGAHLGAVVDASAVPIMDGVFSLAESGNVPGGSRANLRHALANGTVFAATVSETLQLILADAQTSGGLLVAVAPNDASAYLEALKRHGVPCTARIGEITALPGIRVS